ncbi:MAG: hypothetical protein ACRD68_16860 [Pyrinomonadaceae bacterium]
MSKPVFAVGDAVEKHCAVCDEVRGHVVASVTKRGQISRVTCPQCGTRGTFKSAAASSDASRVTAAKTGAPYDWTRTYRTGQSMMHPTYGYGEVTSVIEPNKIDVLFADRLRRLVHMQKGA